jgi:hypothetical protein
LELKELAELDIGFDLSVTGFSPGEIDVLLASKGVPDDETIPAAPAQPRTRLGDIWICGQHRVGCGDGRDIDFLSKVIGNDAAIDAAFLDPPYNVRISGHARSKRTLRMRWRRKKSWVLLQGERIRTPAIAETGACVSNGGAVEAALRRGNFDDLWSSDIQSIRGMDS